MPDHVRVAVAVGRVNVCDDDSVCVSDLLCVNECVAVPVGNDNDTDTLLLSDFEDVPDCDCVNDTDTLFDNDNDCDSECVYVADPVGSDNDCVPVSECVSDLLFVNECVTDPVGSESDTDTLLLSDFDDVPDCDCVDDTDTLFDNDNDCDSECVYVADPVGSDNDCVPVSECVSDLLFVNECVTDPVGSESDTDTLLLSDFDDVPDCDCVDDTDTLFDSECECVAVPVGSDIVCDIELLLLCDCDDDNDCDTVPVGSVNDTDVECVLDSDTLGLADLDLLPLRVSLRLAVAVSTPPTPRGDRTASTQYTACTYIDNACMRITHQGYRDI